MGQFIRREADAAENLVAFWEGDAPSEGDQASVDLGDQLVIFDDDQLLASFDAGRHLLSAKEKPKLGPVLGGDDGAYVAFISLKRYPLENDGELAEEDLETGYSLRAAVQVRDSSKLVGLIAQVDENEQTIEEWLADEIAIDAAAAATEAGIELEDAGDQLDSVRDAALSAANEALREYGVEVLAIDELAFGDFDDEDD